MKIYAALPTQATAHLGLLRQFATGDDLWISAPDKPTPTDLQAFAEAEVVFGLFPADALAEARCLRWIQLFSVGIEAYQGIDWSRFPGIACTNLRGLYADPMAQTMLAGILALQRGLDRLVRLQDRCDWQKDSLHGSISILHGAEVLLLGAGAVNRRLRELLSPFGCRFTTYAHTSGDLRTPAELDVALANADIVCAALPDTPGTRGLLDAGRLGRMKPGALLVNAGRGSLLDETALVVALESGRLGGAVLDVTQHEPLPADDPLWRCPRILLTQHTSAGSREVVTTAIRFFGENLARYRAGRPLCNRVEWTRGY